MDKSGIAILIDLFMNIQSFMHRLSLFASSMYIVCIIRVNIAQPDDIVPVCDGDIVHWGNGANQPDNT